MDGVSILIVDDDTNILKTLSAYLSRRGFGVRTAANAGDGLRALADFPVQIALVDLRLGDDDGIELAHALLEQSPDLVVFIITAYSTIDTAVKAIRKGIYDYLTKPLDPQELEQKLRQVVEELKLTGSKVAAQEDDDGQSTGLLGRSPGMRRARDLVRKISSSDMTILIYGETGTGKEVLARAIHRSRPDRQGRFVGLNCAAIPETLFESELFGHMKGAFTGATRDRVGLLAQAHAGTLFLDELEALSPGLQVKLLRVLQEHSFYPVGGTTPVHLETQVVCATNELPETLVEAGRLREDLFYRICGIRIELPPLRDRVQDLPLLVDHLLDRAAKASRRVAPRVAPALMHLLYTHRWPGNVRELDNVLAAMLAVEQGDLLTPNSLPPEYRGLARPEEGDKQSLSTAIDSLEYRLIVEALRANKGVIVHAAEELGLDERSLRRKMQRLRIEREPDKGG